MNRCFVFFHTLPFDLVAVSVCKQYFIQEMKEIRRLAIVHFIYAWNDILLIFERGIIIEIGFESKYEGVSSNDLISIYYYCKTAQAC